MTITVLITAEKISMAAKNYLESEGCRLIFLKEKDKEAELYRVTANKKIDAILARTYKIDREIIEHCSGLSVISRHGSGFDTVDISVATEKGIPVFVAPGTNSQAVAEMTIGLLLSLARNIVANAVAVSQGQWDRRHEGTELHNKTIGLIGYGRIARAVSAIAKSLGMKVLVFDPYIQNPNGAQVTISIEELLKMSDVISLHCPAQKNNTALLASPEFKLMKDGALLINTSRGSLIDEDALLLALQSGKVKGAGLDTLMIEPPPENHPFLAMPQVVITPHLGGSTDYALEKTALLAAQNIIRFLKRNEADPMCLVNPNYLQRNGK